jgi:hypothetical protein
MVDVTARPLEEIEADLETALQRARLHLMEEGGDWHLALCWLNSAVLLDQERMRYQIDVLGGLSDEEPT